LAKLHSLATEAIGNKNEFAVLTRSIIIVTTDDKFFKFNIAIKSLDLENL